MKDLVIKDKGELKILEGLYLKGYRWVIKEEDGYIWAYRTKPIWVNEVLETGSYSGCVPLYECGIFYFLNNLIDSDGINPLEIAEVLKANDMEV